MISAIILAVATEQKRKKASGPSGKNSQAGVILREERPGQIEAWREAAERAGMTLTAWIRQLLDRAAKRTK